MMLYGRKWIPWVFQSRFAPGIDIRTCLDRILTHFENLHFFGIFYLWVRPKSDPQKFLRASKFRNNIGIRLSMLKSFLEKKAADNSTQICAKPYKCPEMRFYQKWLQSVKCKKCSQDARKMQKFLHFRKVHARTYKKHIYDFFISLIVQKIFAIEEKNRGWYSPLSGIYMSIRQTYTHQTILVRSGKNPQPQKVFL